MKGLIVLNPAAHSGTATVQIAGYDWQIDESVGLTGNPVTASFPNYDTSGSTTAGTWGWRTGLSGGTNLVPAAWADLAGNRIRTDNTNAAAANAITASLGSNSNNPQTLIILNSTGSAKVAAYRVGSGSTYDFVISSILSSVGTPPTTGEITLSTGGLITSGTGVIATLTRDGVTAFKNEYTAMARGDYVVIDG